MKPLSLVLLSSVLAAAHLGYAQQSAQQAPRSVKIRITLIGDSTQTRNAGYGLGFCANLTDDVACINDAKNGASTKTYYQEGYWEKALADKPDYMLIQFGHNDEETKEHLPRQTNPPAQPPRQSQAFWR